MIKQDFIDGKYKYVQAFGDVWFYDKSSSLFWSKNPKITGISCGITFEQLDNYSFLESIRA